MNCAIVVEPSALLRLGIQQLLQQISSDVSCEGIDYPQLFNAPPATRHCDLMLLSVPGDPQKACELIQSAQKGYAPTRILLLSEAPLLLFPLRDLPVTSVVGHVSKAASTAILAAAVNLVMAGGTCFPHPEGADRGSAGSPAGGAGTAPHRRWYERDSSPRARPSADRNAEIVLHPRLDWAPSAAPAGASASGPASSSGPMSAAASNGHGSSALDPDTREPSENGSPAAAKRREARMLNLTPRQYEVLVLLARGYPIKTISRELNISLSTAKTHTDTLYQRLSVHNGQAAVYEALTRGATLGLRQNPLNQIQGAPR